MLLEPCRQCRNVPTLHVRSEDGTPRSMRSPRKTRTPSPTRSSKVHNSSGVPIERALRLTWALRLDVLVQSAAVKLWAWSKHVQLRGSISRASLASVVWPTSLQQLSFRLSSSSNPWLQLCGRCLYNGYLSDASTSQSLELCGRCLYSGYRLGVIETNP